MTQDQRDTIHITRRVLDELEGKVSAVALSLLQRTGFLLGFMSRAEHREIGHDYRAALIRTHKRAVRMLARAERA